MSNVRLSRWATPIGVDRPTRRRTALFAGGLAMLGLACAISLLMPVDATAKGGKGKGGGGNDPPDPTVLPNVRYQLTWLELPGWPEIRARDMNDSGEVVGYAWDNDLGTRTAFLYSPSQGMVDLNDSLAIGAVWIDLETDTETGDWFAWEAEGINELGQIAGTAEHIGGERRAFLFNPDPAQFQLLPKTAIVGSLTYLGDTQGVAVNDLGEVVAFYEGLEGETNSTIHYASTLSVGIDLNFNCDTVADINNSGVIVGRKGHRAWPDGVGGYLVDHFPDTGLYGINEAHVAVGAQAKTKGKNGQDGGPIRVYADDLVQVLFSGSSTNFAFDINDADDACFNGQDRRGFVYTDEHGALPLDDLLVDADDPDWVWTTWPWAINNPNPLTDPEGTGFGQICGATGANRAFLLSPVLPSD